MLPLPISIANLIAVIFRDGYDEEEGNDDGSTTKETAGEILLKEIGQHPEVTL